MNADLVTVLWKERVSLFRVRSHRVRAFLTLFGPLGVFAIYLPWSSGEYWVSGSPSIFACCALPMLVTILTIPESFAGERERHTLETLLASRLPDRALLWGKVLFAVGLAWGAALWTLVLGLVVVNLTHLELAPLFYTPQILWVDLSLSLALAGLGASAGVLISLRSATAQEAQQLLSGALFLPPTVLGPILLLVGRSHPEWSLRGLLEDGDPLLIHLVALATLVVLDALLFTLAARRFRRSRLILS